MLVTQHALGCIAMLSQGLILNSIMVLLRILKERGWPEITLYVFSSVLSAIVIWMFMSINDIPQPAKGERKWVILEGAAWAASFVALTLSVWLKTPLGDVAALTALNCVFASLLGYACLGEPLNAANFTALFLSGGGAIFIAQPSWIFSDTGESLTGTHLGMVLAIASGFFDACVLVCSRLSADSDKWNHCFWALLEGSIAFVFLGSFPSEDCWWDVPMLLDAPFVAAMLIGSLVVLNVANIITYITAAQYLPASLCAMLNVSSNMVFGFIMQVVVFDAPLELNPIVGAHLMLSAVVVSSCWCRESEQDPSEDAALTRPLLSGHK
eukprot:TRINITY_DN14144_c1_g1_i6.p1 TRINITY_DN14144_c1_g1~~TRINITY_DN14144_c1_g1_i6.p1  ORF type:complete len:325 (-),score=45.71 TRINITY_DN14144_c1_g1_i6:139-1113(-)